MSNTKHRVVEPNKIADSTTEIMDKDGKYVPLMHRGINKDFLDLLHITLSVMAERNDCDPNILDYTFSVTDYKDCLGLTNSKDAYHKIKDMTMSALADCALAYPTDKGFIAYNAFQAVEYNDQKGQVCISLSQHFKKNLLELMAEKGKKVYFELSDTLSMKSMYSKKVYPVLLEFKDKTITFNGKGDQQGKSFTRIFSLDEFRTLTNLPESYGVDRLRSVCQGIKNDIDSCTKYSCSFTLNLAKEGRGRYGKLTHICFNLLSIKAEEVKVLAEPHIKDPDESNSVLLSTIVSVISPESTSANTIQPNAATTVTPNTSSSQ